MRGLAILGVLAASTTAVTARAQDASPTPASPPAPSVEALRAELAQQSAAIAELRSGLDAERAAREHPKVRVSGFVQIDWVVHNEQSQDEINGSNGQLLNQDRFDLRRGHLRVDAEQGLVLGAVEIDANTVNGPQVRPIEADVSLRWPEKPDDRLPTLMATAGLMRIPFGYEVQELDYVRPFLERST